MTITRKFIGTIGTISLTLPIIRVGRGRPSVAIVTGLHGGEESGLLIIRDVLASMKRKRQRGSVTVIPSGNPLTQAFKTRFSLLDGANPNRVFPGRRDGDISARIARATIDAVRSADVVIDLHCFSQDCVFTGVLVDIGNPAIAARQRMILQLLKPDCIWIERSATPDGSPIRQNLSGYLNSVGVPSIAIEMPRPDRLTDIDRRRIGESLLRVVQGLSKRTVTSTTSSRIPELVRSDIRADASGFFIPERRPLTSLSRGMSVGRLVDPLTFRETVVRSPRVGRLFLIARPGLVRTGDKLFALGTPVPLTTS